MDGMGEPKINKFGKCENCGTEERLSKWVDQFGPSWVCEDCREFLEEEEADKRVSDFLKSGFEFLKGDLPLSIYQCRVCRKTQGYYSSLCPNCGQVGKMNVVSETTDYERTTDKPQFGDDDKMDAWKLKGVGEDDTPETLGKE